MGMDLIAKNGTDSLHFNWSGWRAVCEFVEKAGVDVSEFAGMNDGDLISKETCVEVAKAILTNSTKYNEMFAGDYYGPNPASEHSEIWKRSEGFEQF